jgi:hypothetical protein
MMLMNHHYQKAKILNDLGFLDGGFFIHKINTCISYDKAQKQWDFPTVTILTLRLLAFTVLGA